jgi:tetratricopeptide (TPR) repeat protein
MAEDFRLSKVSILIQQRKFAEADHILKELLAQDPNDIHYLSLLAEVNLQQDKFDAARKIIDNAIGLSPGSPHLFYIKARIAIQQDKFDEAESLILQATKLDPGDADYFALLANVKLARKKYEEALNLANEALQLDSENLLALNTRSTALLKLNRAEESFGTIEGALREDPNNAYTHANYGWGLLEKGNHKKALEHFREALKNDPNLGYAQAGMMQALKASNPIYRLFLKYAFWMGNLTAKYQWGVIIGFYLLVRGLRAVANNNPSIEPYIFPLIVLLMLIAISTWVITPISNLFLRFNPYGKFLLDKKEKMSSNFVAASFVVFLIGILLYFALKDERYLPVAVFGFAMMLPLGVMFSPSRYKNALVIYTIILAIAGVLAIGMTFSGNESANLLTVIFILGFIAFQWVANYFMIREDNR